jgi:hypothetical protein
MRSGRVVRATAAASGRSITKESGGCAVRVCAAEALLPPLGLRDAASVAMSAVTGTVRAKSGKEAPMDVPEDRDPDDGGHDFDFILGVWEIHNRRLRDTADPRVS